MMPLDLYNYVLDMMPVLPSKASFVKNHVVPATPGDRHYNDKCVFCWEDYTPAHPAAKLEPCGHVLGHTCVHQMVEGPTGDLCPVCRVGLFRKGLSFEEVTAILQRGAESIIIVYLLFFIYSSRVLRALFKKTPRPLLPIVRIVLEGPRLLAMIFVNHCTNVASRNPNLRLLDAFASTALGDFIVNGTFLAPLLWIVHHCFGFRVFKASWLLYEVAENCITQYLRRKHSANGIFANPADRAMVERLVDCAIVVKIGILAVLLSSWSEPSVSLLGTAWNTFAAAV